MTNQEKKAWLGRYRQLDQRIGQLTEEIAVWRSRAEKITPSYGGQPCGGSGDPIQSAAEKIAQLEEGLCQRIDESNQLKVEIQKTIQTVEDPTLQLLLEYRYLHTLTWEQVAERMGYGVRQIHRLHGEALSLLKMS